MQFPYDLSNYKLTLPITKQGILAGSAYEVNPPVQAQPYFTITDNGFVFMCPDHGAVTATAKYPRTELRDLREWSASDTVWDKLKLRVLQCPIDAKIVIHQIHDKKEPWVKIVWQQKKSGGNVYALVKAADGQKDTTIPLLTGVQNNKSVISYIRYDGHHTLTVKANNVLKKITMDRKGLGGKAYFKRGNYFQSNDNSGMVSVVLHCK